jgi:two-component system sensor histidine kinase DctS
MGEMASTLAHELNQPLSAITSYVTGSLNKLQGGNLREGELQQALQTTATQAHRAGKIIRRVHEFVRRREPRRSACDINRVIEEAIAFVESEARKLKVQVVLELANDPPELQADTIMLEQVVLNLAKNGIEAMTETHPKDRLLHVRTSIKDGTIFVSIADHGCGVAPEISEKLFSPFFTTKEHGMGMGLNICRSIIEFHRGKLWFEPNPDGGSTFCFSLPLAA